MGAPQGVRVDEQTQLTAEKNIGGADGDGDKTGQAVGREACCTPELPPHEFTL
ncbi:hypothetical protein [Streptomyces sp. PR69]|uniref:hypothetical protein n=1 Tax=Streptomyces sp. PR69 TaxID=2984950 RepID=UPI003A5C4D91